MSFNEQNAPLAELQRLRSYSRLENGRRESWDETCDRTLYSPHRGLKVLGQFTDEEMALIDEMQRSQKAFGSARWLWVGGTPWVEKPDNYIGAFNCSSFRVIDWDSFGMLMDLAMQGCGTGSVLELGCIDQLPPIRSMLNIQVIGYPGLQPKEQRLEKTELTCNSLGDYFLLAGDSREGWIKAYQTILELSADGRYEPGSIIDVVVDLSNVRPVGEKLKGFGGTANPVDLPNLFKNVAKVLNVAVGRKLNSVEVCLLIDHAAKAVVAGNIRRSAGMKQFGADDELGSNAKNGIWAQDQQGNWYMPKPEYEVLTMSNHTRVFHRKPSEQEIVDAVRRQYYSGEGAIQYAPEAIVRANADLLDTPEKRQAFLWKTPEGQREYLRYLMHEKGIYTSKELDHRLQRYGLNPCGEIIFSDGFCNLASIHLNQLDPFDFAEQEKAFKASSLQAAAFLQRGFVNPRQQFSRNLDPIVGVSFTGAFTFFTKAFGVDWLRWWKAGRPEIWGTAKYVDEHFLIAEDFVADKLFDSDAHYFRAFEEGYLTFWNAIVHETVWDYCDRYNLKRPNRCTTLKPEGSLTLLSGVGCCGHHAPKGWYYIRRMTFAKNDPIALAAIDYGYSVVPSQSDKDEDGKLLNDPLDPRCTEWLIEVPVEEEIVRLFPDAQEVNPGKFSALAQFDFYMQVQKHYVTHNTSATIELEESEIEPLAQRIYQAIQNDEGYISAALLARFEASETFPRLPFEPISKDRYQELMQDVLSRRKSSDFQELIDKHSEGLTTAAPQDAACDSGFCELKASGVSVSQPYFEPVSEGK